MPKEHDPKEARRRVHAKDTEAAAVSSVLKPAGSGESNAERMMAALNILTDGICYFDSDDRLVLYNEAFTDFYGRVADMIKPGSTFHDIIVAGLDRGVWDLHGLDRAEWVRRAMLRRGLPQSQSTFRFSDGTWMMYRDQRTDDGGRIGILTRIDGIKEKEAELAAANRQHTEMLGDLKRMLDQMPVGIIVLDADLKAEVVNRTCIHMWNLPTDRTFVGVPIVELINGNRAGLVSEMSDVDWREFVDWRVKEIASGEVVARDFKRADGRTLTYSITPLSGGKRLLTYIDVTDMSNREAQLAQALEQAELAQAIINALPVPVFIKDSGLRFQTANPAYAKLTGRKPQDLVGLKCGDILPPEQAERYDGIDQKVLDSGVAAEGTDEFVVDGKQITHSSRSIPVTLPNGNTYVAGFLFDVTELQRRQKEADESRRYLVNVLESLPAGVLIYDRDDNFVFANKTLLDAVPSLKPFLKPGSTLQSMLRAGHAGGHFRLSGDAATDSLYDVDTEKWLAAVTKRYHLPSVTYERRIPSGRWWKVNDQRMPDGTFVGARVDITELKDREGALRESMRQLDLFRQVFDEMPVATTLKSQDLYIEFVNRAWCAATGVPQSEAIGKTDKDLFLPAEAAAFMADDASVSRTGKAVQIEESVTHRDGSTRHQMTRTNRLIALDGSMHICSSSADISEIKQREAALKEAQKRAEFADRAKSEFLANMSHEIRTPMNGVLGMAELLAKSELDPKQRTFTDIIVKSGNALLTIINDILDFSKIDAGQLQLDPAPFNLAEAVEDVATLLSTRAKEKDLELIVRIDPDLGQDFIGDAGRVRQIVTNLVGNAVKFTEAGYVLVDVSGEEAGSDARLTFSITDTGIGIPAEKQALIFDKFSQVDASSTRRHEGTGLGLAITSRLVELMGGEIGVESVEGAGSTFWFSITLPHTEQSSRPAPPPVDVTGARVLVVDDNEINRTILSEQMRSWGFDSCAAESGPEALQVLRAAHKMGIHIDCILLDYQMPDMSGAQTAALIRGMTGVEETPIVMLTSVDHSISGPRYRELAIDAHLIKPVRSTLLLETLVATIQKSRTRGDTSAQRGLEDEGEAETALRPAPTPDSAPLPVVPISDVGAQVDVLVAEDNEVNQLVFTQILQQTGYSFRIVGTGRLAVESHKTLAPRMILMDVSMPEMNGLEATDAIRKSESATGRHVPIVGVTAHALKGDRDRCIDAGMDDYLPKPVSPKTLQEKLDRWLKTSPGEVRAM